MRRAAASISPNVKSATVSVSTPGVGVTRTLRSLAAATSMLSKPVAMLLTTTSSGAASSSPASTRSVRRVSRPWQPGASLRSSSADGGSSPWWRRTSACCESSSSAPPGRGRVTRAVGLATLSGDGGPALVRLFPAAEPWLVRRLLAADLVVVHPVVPVIGAQPLHHGQRAEDGACGRPVVVLRPHPLHDGERLLALAAHLGDVLRNRVEVSPLQRYRYRLAAHAVKAGAVLLQRLLHPGAVGRLHLAEGGIGRA